MANTTSGTTTFDKTFSIDEIIEESYNRLGQFDKAAQDFTMCLKLYPKRAPGASATYFHLARALDSLGQKSEAVENLNKALELNNEIGGLSPADAAETKSLLEKLSRGS